ncbi:MAG: SpoIIE family protein phosphatase [Verrucomicrobia bacterium]|nr:SpoIIE family protein phosphatase [Verrucomicrobiota bacterium]
MKTPLRVLVVEDSEFDARILITTLRKGGYEPAFERVQTAETMGAALKDKPWDIILSDYNMPEFDALRALKLLQDTQIDIPFIIISGGIGEDTAVAAMKAGAHDYLMKGSLARLVPAVERELREATERATRRLAQQAVRESEMRYRLLWETATDAVLLMDTNSVIHFANPAVEKVFGYKPDEVVEQNLTLLLPERVHGNHQESFSRYLVSGVSESRRRVMETVGRRKEDAEVLIEIAFNDMEFQGKRWFVAFIRDITERKRAEQELMEHQEQFRIAREIQQRLFPKSAPNFPGFDIAGISHPAEAAGGDYFDYLHLLDGGLGLVVADVTGHGVGPALLMAETRAYLRVVSLNRHDVGEVLTRANLILAEDVGGERYVTLLMVRLDAGQRRLTYANAGHPAAAIIGRDGEIRTRLRRTGVPLGLKPGVDYETSQPIDLNEGDTILLLTDGIEEAISPKGELFGVERAVQVAQANAGKSSAHIADALYQAVRQFAGNQPQEDDITAIVIQVR